MRIDKDGQAFNASINADQNTAKSFETLLGILSGINADNQINENELTLLSVWLDEAQYLHNDPDVVDIRDVVSDIQQSKIISQEQFEDLQELINTVIEYRDIDIVTTDDGINRLIGITMGIIADNELKDEEIKHLNHWLNSDPELVETWPANVIADRIKEILKDGKITQEEKTDLLAILIKLQGQSLQSSGAVNLATRLPVDEIDELIFPNRLFCFTGKFVYGNRSNCHRAVINKGGSTTNKLNQKVDYLVIGTLSSRDWANTSHGRKIEYAMKLRSSGADSPLIISEEFWVNFI